LARTGVFEEPQRSDGICVVPGDVPNLSAETVRACFRAYRSRPRRIVIAAHAGKRGHPIVFPFALKCEVDVLTGGLNELIQRHEQAAYLVDTDDAGALADINTPAEYDRESAAHRFP